MTYKDRVDRFIEYIDRQPVKGMALVMLLCFALAVALIGLVAGGQWLVGCVLSGWCG